MQKDDKIRSIIELQFVFLQNIIKGEEVSCQLQLFSLQIKIQQQKQKVPSKLHNWKSKDNSHICSKQIQKSSHKNIRIRRGRKSNKLLTILAQPIPQIKRKPFGKLIESCKAIGRVENLQQEDSKYKIHILE